ncbi:unnamed protein product [Effrenium voratum]|nr:unnamed protein product [Effrenium voratum]
MWLHVLWPLVLAVHVPLDDESTALVQRGASRRPQPMLQADLPLKFLHVPKSGTSFYNVLIHTDGVCPEFPKALNIDDDSLGAHPENVLLHMCKKLCPPNTLSCNEHPHEGLGGENWTRYKGHVVAMFRNPLQRLCSAYYDPVFDFVGDTAAFPQAEYPLRASDENGPLPHRISLQQFALRRAGDATRQLVRAKFQVQEPSRVTEEDSHLAVSRLREGFAFIGITEEWDISVCLFHRMFGGQCMPSDFEDMRPHSPGETAAVPYEDADTITDPYDMPVYEEAVRVFKENLVKYDVSEETCKACFAAKR